MDAKALSLAASGLVTPGYIHSGSEALNSHAQVIRSILAQRRCPEQGLSDLLIEHLLLQLALMDSNNFPSHIGAGEREGRVASELVRRRHFGLIHGVGRSGDLCSDQPKAAGSSLLFQLANTLMLDLLHLAGAKSLEKAVVVPMATGMTLSLALAALRRRAAKQQAPLAPSSSTSDGPLDAGAASPTRRFVIWPRVDQKTALKCIDAAGLVAVPVELRSAPLTCARTRRSSAERRGSSTSGTDRQGGERDADLPPPHPYLLQVHVDDIRAAVGRVGGAEHVLCVLSTTSCFAPRIPDDVLAIARLCEELGIGYVVNNAYGVQSKGIMTRLEAACRLSRVDYVVQSGDKNFLVPVGGSILAGPARSVDEATSGYAGRASAAPATDLFITALSLGRAGFLKLWETRARLRDHMCAALARFASERGEELVEGSSGDAGTEAAARNDISFAITMRSVDKPFEVGARLFRYHCVTGPRVIGPSVRATTIGGHAFRSYGCHRDEAPCAMLVMACGIGMEATEVDTLLQRLRSLWPAT